MALIKGEKRARYLLLMTYDELLKQGAGNNPRLDDYHALSHSHTYNTFHIIAVRHRNEIRKRECAYKIFQWWHPKTLQ